MHCRPLSGLLLGFIERRWLFGRGEVNFHIQDAAREPRWLCISDQVIDSTDPKRGVIMVLIEILFIDLLFMPPALCAPL
jgi:hypothetical protein